MGYNKIPPKLKKEPPQSKPKPNQGQPKAKPQSKMWIWMLHTYYNKLWLMFQKYCNKM